MLLPFTLMIRRNDFSVDRHRWTSAKHIISFQVPDIPVWSSVYVRQGGYGRWEMLVRK